MGFTTFSAATTGFKSPEKSPPQPHSITSSIPSPLNSSSPKLKPTMKFRIRSQSTKQTHRIKIPDSSTLADLKTLIAATLSLSVSPNSLRLSLNATDELTPQNPDDPLPLLGLANGDTLYLSVVPQTLTPNPNSSEEVSMDIDPARVDAEKPSISTAVTETLAPPPNPNSNHVTVDIEHARAARVDAAEPDGKEVAVEIDDDFMDAELDDESVVLGNASSSMPLKISAIPCFLNRVMEAEKGDAESVLGKLVIFVHAALLESGFVVSGGSGFELPKNWVSKAAGLLIPYTLGDIENGRCVDVRFSVIGMHATVYGYLVGGRDVYRVSMNLGQLAGLLCSDMSDLGELEAKEFFELWKVVKDGLSLPLLIDFCVASGIVLPSCFMSLPTELKIKIVGCLRGVDAAKVGCTCTELRFLSSNDDLWKQKYVEEFGDEKSDTGRSWKIKYALNYMKRRIVDKNVYKRRRLFGVHDMPMIYPGGLPRLPRFPVVGGYHDIFPDFSILDPAQPRVRYPMGSPGFPAGRRNLSPNCCNLPWQL